MDVTRPATGIDVYARKLSNLLILYNYI
jgi:hypothetical protein